jgi:hypothetical protein
MRAMVLVFKRKFGSAGMGRVDVSLRCGMGAAWRGIGGDVDVAVERSGDTLGQTRTNQKNDPYQNTDSDVWVNDCLHNE